MKMLLTTTGFTIAYDPVPGVLHLTWSGMHGEAESKACGLKVLEEVRATGATKILNDALLDEDGWGELTRWLAYEWMGLLAQAGVVAVAWVLPENLRARTDVQNVLARTTCPLIDAFTDTEAAYNWLQRSSSVPKPGC